MQGSGFRVQGPGFRVQGSGSRVEPRGRAPPRRPTNPPAPRPHPPPAAITLQSVSQPLYSQFNTRFHNHFTISSYTVSSVSYTVSSFKYGLIYGRGLVTCKRQRSVRTSAPVEAVRATCFGFRASGFVFGFRASGSGFGYRRRESTAVWAALSKGFGFRVLGLGIRVSGIGGGNQPRSGRC